MGITAFALAAFVLALQPARASAPPARGGGPAKATPWQLQRLFDCIECTPAQLTAVKALGDTVVPELALVLENGPSSDRLKARRQYLERQWRAMKDYEAGHPSQRVIQTRQEYVDSDIVRYTLLQRARAATALGAIHTPAAMNVLNKALLVPGIHDKLRAAIIAALQAAP